MAGGMELETGEFIGLLPLLSLRWVKPPGRLNCRFDFTVARVPAKWCLVFLWMKSFGRAVGQLNYVILFVLCCCNCPKMTKWKLYSDAGFGGGKVGKIHLIEWSLS
jgi:hypothetical protein